MKYQLRLGILFPAMGISGVASPLSSSTCRINDSGINVANGYDSGVVTQTISQGSTSCIAGPTQAGIDGIEPFSHASVDYSFTPGYIHLVQQNGVTAGETGSYVQVSAESSIQDTEQVVTGGPVRDGKLLNYLSNSGIGPVNNWSGGAGVNFPMSLRI